MLLVTNSIGDSVDRAGSAEPKDSPSESWFARLGWVVAASYVIGVACRKAFQALWGYPFIAPDSLVEVNQVLFGGVMLLFAVTSSLTMFAMHARRPWREAGEWYGRIRARHPSDREPSRLGRGLAKFMRWQSTVTSYVAPYFLSMYFVAFLAAGGWNRDALVISLYLTGMTFIGWTLSSLRQTGKFARELDLLSPNAANLLGIEKRQHGDFSSILFLVLGAVSCGAMFYPRVLVSLGGGKPIPAILTLSEKADTMKLAPLRGISGQNVFLVESNSEFVAVERLAEDRSTVIAIPREFVAALESPRREAKTKH